MGTQIHAPSVVRTVLRKTGISEKSTVETPAAARLQHPGASTYVLVRRKLVAVVIRVHHAVWLAVEADMRRHHNWMKRLYYYALGLRQT